MKKLFSLIFSLLFLSTNISYAISYDDINTIKDPSYRVGATDNIENKVEIETRIQMQSAKMHTKVENNENLTYADLSIKKISSEIAQDLDMDYDTMLADLSVLWQGAATQSDTIKYALYQLYNPNADKPDQHSIKKVLSTIASLSTLIGAGTGNPMLSCASLIGGNTLGIMSQDTKALNYKYTKVDDADMIILVRKVDELQQKVVIDYFDYMTTKEVLEKTSRMVKRRLDNYNQAQECSREIILITDAYYREALDQQAKARSNFNDARSRLEQVVGNDALTQFENILKSRK